jgi:sucrose-6-phosphate hydrolase SacC (GH32 family)
MSVPIFVDPIHDGAADPAVIWNAGRGEWWMFYTNRRAGLEGAGVGWIHGSAIGIATSPDGLEWAYRGTAKGLDDPADSGLNTHWAPEVIFAAGQYHMFLTYIAGAPDRFEGTPRTIVHLSGPDLETWTRHGALGLSSGNVIDAAVALCPDGLYRLWYKDEADGSSTWAASSPDLSDWRVEGKVIPGKPDGFPHEGPNVFQLGGWWWLIVDEWRGQAVFRSTDAKSWQRQGLILDAPGRDPADRSFARHADVVPQGDWAALFYFTHPEWDEAARTEPLTTSERRTTIHVARLGVINGVLVAERDVPAQRLRA